MPVARRRFFPEIESAGGPKKILDVLLWFNEWKKQNWEDLDDIEILRDYLRSIIPPPCGIRVLVPDSHVDTAALLEKLNVRFKLVKVSDASPETLKAIGEKEFAGAVETALVLDADVLVIENATWLPYIEDLEKLGLFLTNTGFLKHYCEIFVRGHEVPWVFTSKIWNLPWNAFYHRAESKIFHVGLDFLYAASQKKATAEAQETGRSLVHNRLPNICFTRDRLLFYELQRLVARRRKWKRQEFAFESSYYLNFYYPLIYGGFDQTALLVNECLRLGLDEKNVGATYRGFLDALRANSANIYGIFVEPKIVEFMKRVAYLRHYASHRGSLAPGKLLKTPDKELSDIELDVMIAEAGMEDMIARMPEGELRDNFRQVLRSNFKMREYEKAGVLLEGTVLIQVDGKAGLIRPAADIEWNFQNFVGFMNRVLVELKAAL